MRNIDTKKAMTIRFGAASLLIAALLFAAAGCGNEQEAGTAATQTPASSAPTAAPTPTPSPTKEPDPTPTPVPDYGIRPYLRAS